MSVDLMNDETAAHVPQKRKLELCKSYTDLGYCAYGDNCFFAHGVQELVRHQPILRKKMCRNYHQHKYCKFGSRCNFVHDPHHGFQAKKPLSMLKLMEEYPEFLTSLSFKKKLLHFL